MFIYYDFRSQSTLNPDVYRVWLFGILWLRIGNGIAKNVTGWSFTFSWLYLLKVFLAVERDSGWSWMWRPLSQQLSPPDSSVTLVFILRHSLHLLLLYFAILQLIYCSIFVYEVKVRLRSLRIIRIQVVCSINLLIFYVIVGRTYICTEMQGS